MKLKSKSLFPNSINDTCTKTFFKNEHTLMNRLDEILLLIFSFIWAEHVAVASNLCLRIPDKLRILLWDKHATLRQCYNAVSSIFCSQYFLQMPKIVPDSCTWNILSLMIFICQEWVPWAANKLHNINVTLIIFILLLVLVTTISVEDGGNNLL